MRYRKTLLAGALVAALVGGVAWAQTVTSDNLSGSESWDAGQGPGGPSTGFITSNLVRNSFAKVLNAASGTFGTGALANLRNGGYVIYTTQPLAAVTLTLPPSPVVDGSSAGFCNATASNFATTAIAFATNTGQSLTSISITALTATSCVDIVFDRTTLSWLRIN